MVKFRAVRKVTKVLLIIRSLNPGGAERQLATLAQNVDAQEFAVTVAPFYAGGAIAEELFAAGVTVRPIGKAGRWNVGGFAARLARLVREVRPDVVHGYLDVPNLVALATGRACGARVVWSVRTAELDWARLDAFSRRTFRAACRLSHRADAIICNSHAGQKYHLAQGYPIEKTQVIINGIDTARFRIDRAAGAQVRAEWGVALSEKLIGLVGRLNPIKNHNLFLAMAAHLAARRDDVRFVCVGTGPAYYRRDLQMRAQALGLGARIIWAGPRQDLTAVYNALSALALTSESEGFPNVLAEAMACGVPCVTTDAGDAAHIVGPLGAVLPHNNAALASEILAQTLAAPVAAEVLRRRIVENFSVAQMVERTAAVWRGTERDV